MIQENVELIYGGLFVLHSTVFKRGMLATTATWIAPFPPHALAQHSLASFMASFPLQWEEDMQQDYCKCLAAGLQGQASNLNFYSPP